MEFKRKSRKISNQWSAEDILKLIENIQLRTSLWDYSHSDYKNRNIRQMFMEDHDYAEKQPKKKQKTEDDVCYQKAKELLSQPSDSEQIFGDFVAQTLRELPPNLSRQLKLTIQKEILNTSMRAFEPEIIICNVSQCVELE